VLDFDGGVITFSDGTSESIQPFDAADIDQAYAGKTAELRSLIAATVLENYEGLALDVVVVPDETVPVGEDCSTVYFGGQSSSSFGMAEQIDPYNQDRCDDAVVYGSAFSSSTFGRQLSLSELATAMGNVAAHEVGHLLGLNHVANVNDLMDTTGSASTILLDQEFVESPLDDSIFPIGTQDAFLWLAETLGLI
jgi:hypothetical protein